MIKNKLDLVTISKVKCDSELLQMLEGEPPMSNYEPYEAARYLAEGHRPMFRAKGPTHELRE